MSKVLSTAIGALAMSVCFVSAAHAGWGPQAIQHIGAAASPASAPEIDPATALGGLTLLLGSLAVIRGRRAKK